MKEQISQYQRDAAARLELHDDASSAVERDEDDEADVSDADTSVDTDAGQATASTAVAASVAMRRFDNADTVADNSRHDAENADDAASAPVRDASGNSPRAYEHDDDPE